jgi:hypothetical protein
MSWSTTKPERWLEWKKVEDYSWHKWQLYYAAASFVKDYQAADLENMYGLVKREHQFLYIESMYENCPCGSGKRLNDCKHEHTHEPSEPMQQEPAVPSEEEAEDDSWMQMDPEEDSADGGATGKSKQKKKKKKQKKKGKK